MDVRYAVGLPNVGEFGDVRTLLQLAVAAEERGWDGVHLWDHLLYHDPTWPARRAVVGLRRAAHPDLVRRSWPRRPGLRRAARFDGAMPTFPGLRARNAPVGDFAAAASFVRQRAAGPVDIAVEGASTAGPDAAREVAPYASAGMTWWIEACGWWRGGHQGAESRIDGGPPEHPAT